MMFEFKNISFIATGERKIEILKKVNLQFSPGKIYVITGPNGGGKSTLAKLAMGILRPTNGSIYLDENDITNLDITERAKLGIGYSFQNPARFKGIKVRDLLTIAAGDHANKLDMCEILSKVGLCAQDYLDRDVDAGLSGGEIKRIEIATVLARNLKVAIFDEPEAGIDLWSFKQMSETFKSVHEQTEITMIIISHQERIMKLADEIIVLSDGKVLKHAGADEILSGILNGDICSFNTDCHKGVANHA